MTPLFLLIAALQSPGGELHAFVIDYDLSREDCAATLAAGVSAIELSDGTILDISTAAVWCELDTAS